MDGSQRQGPETVKEVAAALPWLCPSATALESLASEPTPISDLAFDPPIVLLALRFVRPSSTPETFTFRSLRDSVVAEAAARLLATPTKHWLNPARDSVRELGERSRRLSQAAREYADRTGNCPPDAAAAIGLLAPLGAWAMAAVEPDAPIRDHDSIARRLGSRWRLPDWVAATVANANLPLADAVRLGADPELSRMLREIGSVERSIPRPDTTKFENPHAVRLLPELLRSAARARRVTNDYRLRKAESEVDRLHSLLGEVRDDFEIAVRDAKLSGLAELAAGAGHEINNPLAIISGHAQRLRKAGGEPDQQKVFDVILKQTDRISDIVRELMQFARPAVPNRSPQDANEIVAEVIEDLEPEAAAKNIDVVPRTTGGECRIECDSIQARKIVKNLIRNAIEAAPENGQVRIDLIADGGGVRIVVEDNGPGPRDEAVPHLFDPFYSGRSAGRGRGLGLATAWRLASINGGDIQFHRDPDGPTRFVLEFPAMKSATQPLKIPA